jgi:protein involved in polysaccharide export with SLBB domain
MSIVVAVPGSVQQPTSVKLPNTNVNDVLSLSIDTSGGVTTVVGIVIVNQDGSAQKVTVWWNDGVTDFAIFERSVPANETVTVALDAPIVLYTKQSAKKIKAQAAKASVVTVTVLYTLASQRAQA